MLCTLFVHVYQDTRFLLVRRETAFPVARFNRSDWRLLAVGAEPQDETGRAALLRDGFYEYRVSPRID